MLEFRLETNLDFFAGVAREYEDLFDEAVIRKLDTLDALMQQDIQRQLEGPVLNHITGKLVRSIEMIPAEAKGNTIEGSVQAGGGVAWYAIVQEEGVDHPWDIVPNKAKALRFMMGGNLVFARKVHHPPLPGKHFMRDTFERWKPEILAQLKSIPGEVTPKS